MAGQIYWNQLDAEVVQQIKDAFNGILTPDGTTITVNESGVISVNGGDTYVLPTASTTVLGGVKVDGTTITIDANGVITSIVDAPVDIVNDLTTGGVDKVLSAEQGKVLKGLIDALVVFTQEEKDKLAGIADNANNYSLPMATALALGGIRIGTGLEIDGDGVVKVTASSEYTQVAPFLPTVKHNEAPIKVGVTTFLSKDAATFNAEWVASIKLPSTVTRLHIQTVKNDTTAILTFQVVTAFQGTTYYAQYIRSASGLGWGTWKQVGQFDMAPVLPDVDLNGIPVGPTSFFALAGDANSGAAYTAWLTAIGEPTVGNEIDRFIHVHTERTLYNFHAVQTVTLYNIADGEKKQISQYYRLLTGTTTWGQFNKVNTSNTEKPKTSKFTTTVAEATIVNGSESETVFVFKPSVPILSTDDLDVNYNTTSLKDGDWKVQDVEGEMVIILNVEQDANIAKNSVSGRIYRGLDTI